MKLESYLLAALLALAGPPSAALAQGALTYGPAEAASSGDVSAAVSTATLAAPTGNATWAITGLNIEGAYATTPSIVVCTVTGMQGGTMTLDVPVGLITMVASIIQPPLQFAWAIPLSAVPATAVVFSCPSFGTGNTHASINIYAILIH
jgi:hypothetical protein